MFNIGSGRVVDVWSNGAGSDGVVDYGVAVATSSVALDDVAGGVSAPGAPVPEPGSLWLLGGGVLGLLGMLAWRRQAVTG